MDNCSIESDAHRAPVTDFCDQNQFVTNLIVFIQYKRQSDVSQTRTNNVNAILIIEVEKEEPEFFDHPTENTRNLCVLFTESQQKVLVQQWFFPLLRTEWCR